MRPPRASLKVVSDFGEALMFRRLWSLFRKEEPTRVFLLGLSNAGKTTFLKLLQLDQFTNPTRTMGLDVEDVEANGLFMKVWDVGGQDTFRESIWLRLLELKPDVIIYVVDSADHDALQESENWFRKIALSPQTKTTPIVVLANKQDLPNALSPGELAIQMHLFEAAIERGESANPRTFRVFPTSLKTGEGVDELLEYLESLFKDLRKKKK